MRRQVAAVALLLAVGSLTACAEYTTTGAPQETADVQDVAASPGAGEQDALAGTSWTLVDSSMDAGLEQFGITAEFSDGAIAGQAPVNRYNASFEVEGDQITFGPVASTMMAGEPVAMEAEGAYFALLSTVTGFHQAADSLTFLADEVPVLMFESGTADVPLDDTASAQAAADKVVGLTAAEAEKALSEAGLIYRVISEDGQPNPVTMDFRVDRVNVVLVDGKVESATVG